MGVKEDSAKSHPSFPLSFLVVPFPSHPAPTPTSPYSSPSHTPAQLPQVVQRCGQLVPQLRHLPATLSQA